MHDETLSPAELGALFEVPLFSDESAQIIAAGRRKSGLASRNRAEVHAQLGLNIAPCPGNCRFCSFAAVNGIFKDSEELSPEEAVSKARHFETDQANAIFVMATAHYPFEKFVAMGQELSQQLQPETVLIANFGDLTQNQAQQLKDAGFAGIYHAVRLGEGKDTNFQIEARLNTFRNAHEVGLLLGTCLEPVGNEHTTAELVEKTIITRDAQPVYSGSARRIPISNTDLSRHGQVSETRMAHIIAVVRLALPTKVPGNCTHEPNVIGCAAGANLLWAESGSNPRDTEKDTEGQRGMTVADCRQVLAEAEWQVLDGPSIFYHPY